MMIKATDIVVGTGKTAVKGALIVTEYTGYLMDGTVFDAHLAYGDRAVGKIPPNSPLRFEITLLEVRTRDD